VQGVRKTVGPGRRRCSFFLCDLPCDFLGALYHFRDRPGRSAKESLQRVAFGADCRPETDSVHIAVN